MRMRFKCHGCGKVLTRSYSGDRTHGDIYASPWYMDASGLRHLGIVCLACGTVHDCSGAFLKGLITFGRNPMKVHQHIRPAVVNEMAMAQVLSRASGTHPGEHGRISIPDGVINVLTERGIFEPPERCGTVVAYRQPPSREPETFGEFLFEATDVAGALVSRLRESPHLIEGEEGLVLTWLEHRDPRKVKPTNVPLVWSRFQYIADDLIREGRGKVRCLRCDRTFLTGDLIPKDDRARPGWNFDRLHCPGGHPILVVEKVHLLMKSR